MAYVLHELYLVISRSGVFTNNFEHVYSIRNTLFYRTPPVTGSSNLFGNPLVNLKGVNKSGLGKIIVKHVQVKVELEKTS